MSTTQIIALALVQYGPSLARALVEIFATQEPTQEQWDRVFVMAEKSYDDYVKPKA